ncbi:MAG: dephospho-CoA kinase [Bacteroidetes bacterium]|nr:dephospho-CoA kinase [Bacteroidota bacterium]
MSKNGETTGKNAAPLRVGITGGIGSGKTTVCRIFEQLEIPVYYADERARVLMTEDGALVEKIKRLFGQQAYFEDGTLDRKYIGNIVFQDKPKLERLNSIVHPAVFEDVERWHQKHLNAPYTLKEAALLFESGSYKNLEKIITVFAPTGIRIERVMLRDGVTSREVESRILKQWPDEKKMELADFVIVNDGKRLLVPQVLEVHKSLLALNRSA